MSGKLLGGIYAGCLLAALMTPALTRAQSTAAPDVPNVAAGAPQPAARSPWGTSCGNHLNILLASGGERAGKSRVFNGPTMCSGRVRDSTQRLSRSEGQRRK